MDLIDQAKQIVLNEKYQSAKDAVRDMGIVPLEDARFDEVVSAEIKEEVRVKSKLHIRHREGGLYSIYIRLEAPKGNYQNHYISDTFYIEPSKSGFDIKVDGGGKMKAKDIKDIYAKAFQYMLKKPEAKKTFIFDKSSIMSLINTFTKQTEQELK